MKHNINIYEQFANDASFLWVLRSIAIDQPNYSSANLSELEQRIDTLIDGLMTGPEISWQICMMEALALKQKGEAFVAAMVAFRSLDVSKIQQIVELGMENTECFSGLASALAWLPGRLCHSWVKKFFISKDLNHKYLAVTVCSLRREDPLDYLTTILQRQDCLAHDRLYSRSLRLIGELKRQDLFTCLSVATSSNNQDVCFWAIWSTVMLGDKSSVDKLKPFVLKESPFQAKAIDLVFRVLSIGQAREWIQLLAKDTAQVRNVIKATAILGDPQAMPWLIAQMRVPMLSRLAGEAFFRLTGIDLQEHNLALDELPNLDDYLPSTDDSIEIHEDEYLPFPDVNKVAAVWQKYQQRFMPSQRYFMGKLTGGAHLREVYRSGNQRMRKAAALEIALMDPSHFYMNAAQKCNSADDITSDGIVERSPVFPSQWQAKVPSHDGLESLSVISVGMVCALGNNSALVSAAVKAGLSGYAASDFFNRQNKEVVMAQVESETLLPLSLEFSELNQKKPGYTFIVRLAATALLDCLSEAARSYPLPIFMACPEVLPSKNPRVEPSFLHHLKALSQCNIDIANSRCIHEGRAGGITALDIAFKFFRATGREFALIGGVDSYRFFDSQLEYLDKANRLLAEGVADGFAPGEGASFILLASPQACEKYSLTPKLLLGRPGLSSEAGHRYSEAPYRGDGLSQACRQALAYATPNVTYSRIYSSLNGESFGAKELGVAQIRNHPYFNDDLVVHHPADCFGDIGAATAPMLFGLIANNEKIPSVVCCSADGPLRGAVCVWQPEYV